MTPPNDGPKVVALRPSRGDHKKLEAPAEKVSAASELRTLADDIDAGKHGMAAKVQIALSILGDKLIVAGMNVDGTEAHYLMACGMRRFEEPALRMGLDG
jgi:hypothetical protein